MPLSSPSNIGTIISDLREERGLTQSELAHKIGSSQSAVARIESGEQNLTIEIIDRISSALGKSIINLSDGSMDFQITGGMKLLGEVAVNTAKNSATALLCASLLNRGKTLLHKMPRIEEVARILEVLESIGVSARWVESDIEIKPPEKFELENLNATAATRTRSALYLAGALSHYMKSFSLPHAGGCKLGSRTIRPHMEALKEFGIETTVEDDRYNFKVRKNMDSVEIILYESGDTATVNAILAAAKRPPETVIKYASANYQVQDVCFFLQSFGVDIKGIGTTTLTIRGKEDIAMSAHGWPSEDPTEAMFFLAAAIVTGSPLTIRRAPIDFLELELVKLKAMGLQFEKSKSYTANNGNTRLIDLTIYPSKLVALEEKIYARPYPGLNIDNLPFFAAIATVAEGTTLIHDWVYEKRAIYYTELEKLGAKAMLADPHRIFITGPTEFKPADLACPPALRPATILLIAMLAADGVSTLRNVYSINRGYEDLVNRLNKLGARVKTVTGPALNLPF